MHDEIQFRAELFQQRDIAAAFVTENKIRSDANALDLSEITNQSADKRLARLPAETAIKPQQQQRVAAERFNRPQLLRLRIDKRRHAIRRDDGIRMPVECEHKRSTIVLPRVR